MCAQKKATLLSVSSVPLAQFNSTLHPVSAPYAMLRPGIPWIKGRGWLNFSNAWTLKSVGDSGDPTTSVASWTRRGAGRSNLAYDGTLEAVFPYLTPATKYGVMMRVLCSASGRGEPAFHVDIQSGPASSGAVVTTEEGEFVGGALIGAHPPAQMIFMLIDPGESGFAVLTVVPSGLSQWEFHSLVIDKSSS
jgi:hypothetical protein